VVLILNKRRSALRPRVGDNENEPVDVVLPETIAEARKSIRKIIVYLAERAAVDDHRKEYGGE
jgi:hypothetical protein